jgi:hypothetical protein
MEWKLIPILDNVTSNVLKTYNCFGSWICLHQSEGSDLYGIGVHTCILLSCFIIENTAFWKLSAPVMRWKQNWNPSASDLLCWPNLDSWPNPVERTEYTSYNTWCEWVTFFFGTVTMKFALLLLWLLCFHGKLVIMIMIEFTLWLHTLGLNGDHSLSFLVSH